MANNEILLKLKGVSDFSDIQNNVKTLQSYFSKLKLPKDATKGLDKSLEDLDRELQKFQLHLNSGFKTKGDVTGLEKSGKKIIQLFSNIENVIDGIDTSDLKKAFQIDTSELTKAKAIVDQLKNELSGKIDADIKLDVNGQEKIVNLKKSIDELFKNSKAKQRLIDFKDVINSGDIEAAKKQLESLRTYADKYFGETSVKGDAFKAALSDISLALENMDNGDSFAELAQRIKQAQEAVDKIETSFDETRESAASAVRDGIKGMSQGLNEYEKSAEQAAQTQKDLNSQFNAIKDQVTHYFSLINAAQLLRRAFQDVYNTVKELDAVMTETAVVTDFSVGDMWDKLPEYTKQAKTLGVATKDLYAATTLYYQQGLKSEAAMAAGVETMKMAKIAGMESAAATDAMTAALRGFNMEVNETNAQRVNDVYSKLAAITASDTEEIATAMSKTASIASAVGAEFENIAVFLAQGIETTRESADSIGTALKTVLARFNELTKDPLEIGEVDGEIVDANKVETALKSVGIALRDTNGQFRDADEVLLNVASKWNTMSVMQQRYIATQAAGSRQQSRFIAMMSDYNRTLELQSAAYNAEGAAEAQYGKTLDSLESKMAKLKDTWDEFILGIVNSEAIKIGVDALSKILEVINTLTSSSSGLTGAMQKAFVAFTLFRGAKALFEKLVQEISQIFLQAGQQAGASFQMGLSGGVKKIDASSKSFKGLTKRLTETKKAIKDFSDKSAISLKDLGTTMQQVSPKMAQQIASMAGPDLTKNLIDNLRETGVQFSETGEEWAEKIIQNFILEIQSGEGVNTAIQNFKTKVKEGLSDANVVTNSTDVQNVDINKMLPQIDPSKIEKELKSGELEKKAQAFGMALAGVGMGLSTIGSKLEEVGGATGQFGSALSIAGDSASSAGMALSTVTSIAAALGVTLTTGPLVALVAIVAVVSAVVSVIKKNKEAAEQARKASIEAAQASTEEVRANRDLAKSFDDAIQQYEEGVISKKELAEASMDVAKKYGLETEAMEIATKGYEEFKEAVDAARLAEEKYNIETQQIAADSLKTTISDKLNGLENISIGSTSDEATVTGNTEFENEFKNLLNEFGFAEGDIIYGAQGQLSIKKELSEFTDKELASIQTFAKKYINALNALLKKQNKTPTDSEVYNALQNLFGPGSDLDTAFNELNSIGDSLRESQDEIGFSYYERNTGTITDRASYERERDKLFKELIKQGIAKEDAMAQARAYFSDYSYARVDMELAEIATNLDVKLTGEDDALDTIKLISQYLNGEISPELLLQVIGSVNVEDATSTSDLNELLSGGMANLITLGGDAFLDATQGIKDYINQNFTIKGIDQNILNEFELQLGTLQQIVPEGVNLLEEWNLALKQGTLGISQFFINTQSLLSGQSSSLQLGFLYERAYGTPFSADSIKRIYETYISNTTSQEDKKAILYKYGFEDEKQLRQSYLFSRKDSSGKVITIQDLYNMGQQKALETYGITQKEYQAFTATDEEGNLLYEGALDFAILEKQSAVDTAKKELNEYRTSDSVMNAIEKNFGAAFYQSYLKDPSKYWKDGKFDTNLAIADAKKNYSYKVTAADFKDVDTNATSNIEVTGVAAGSSYANMLVKAEAMENFLGEEGSVDETSAKGIYISNQISVKDATKILDLAEENQEKAESEQSAAEEDANFLQKTALWINEAGEAVIKENSKGNVSEGTGLAMLAGYAMKGLTRGTDLVQASDAVSKATEDVANATTALTNATTAAEDDFENFIAEVKRTPGQIEAAIGNGMKDFDDSAHVQKVKDAENADLAYKYTEDYTSAINIGEAEAVLQQAQIFYTQWGQVQELVKDGMTVDLETFNQLTDIMPEIIDNTIMYEDGLFDVSAGLQAVEDGTKQDIEAKIADAKATLVSAMSDEQAYIDKLKRIKDYITARKKGASHEKAIVEAGFNAETNAQANAAYKQATINEKLQEDIGESSDDTTTKVIENTKKMAQVYDVLANSIANVVQNQNAIAGEGEAVRVLTEDTEKQIKDIVSTTTFSTDTDTKDYKTEYQNLFDSLFSESADLNTLLKGISDEDLEGVEKMTDYLLGGARERWKNKANLLSSLSSTFGSGKDEAAKELEELDGLFNTLQKIKQVQEEINLLEKEYSNLMEEEIPNLEEIQKNIQKRLELLEKERKLLAQKGLVQTAILEKWEKDNKHLSEYVWYDKELGRIQIDHDKINKVTNEELYDEIIKAMDDGEKITDDADQLNQDLFDNEQKIADLRDAGNNKLDKSFNTLEKIAKVEKDIDNLESKRELLLADAASNAEEIIESYFKQKDLLEQQLKLQEQLKVERQTQLEETLKEAEQGGYMKYVVNLGDGQFSVDQEAIDKLNQEEQDTIKKVVDKLNDSADAYEKSEKAVLDANKAIKDFQDNLRDDAFDFFDSIKELVIADYQKKIDQLTEENTAITDAETKMFDSIQKSLDQQRQERENQKTEEDIANKEARLAYLKADTTGANALEIKNLEKELAEQKEDYTDTLIDQKISELQRQNEEAAAQREVQISLAEAQLAEMERNGEINDKVQTLIDEGIGSNGEIKEESDLYKLIQNSADYTGLTATQQEAYWADLQKKANEYLAYIGVYKNIGGKDGDYKLGTDVTSKLSGLPEGATAQVTGENRITVTLADGTRFSAEGITSDLLNDLNFSQLTGKGTYYTAADARTALRFSAGIDRNISEEEQARLDANSDGKITASDARLILRNAAQMESIDFGDDYYGVKDFFTMVDKLNQDEKWFDEEYDFNGDGKITDEDLFLLVEKFGVKKYKTGGLADFTGPAWLDGTASKPEMVLNARDTENFIQLKDILSSVLHNLGSRKESEKTGDMYYEIHIDVEKMTSDYDVDDVANRVKTIIAQDAMYRNNNIINRLR